MLILLVLVLVVVVLLVKGPGQRQDRFVTRWARGRALVLTPENRPMVDWSLRVARSLRTWGALGGAVLAWIVPGALGFDGQGFLWAWIFLGYLAGALYAEVALVRPAGAGDRNAGLGPRDLADYLPRRLLLAQRLLGVAIAAGALTAALAPYGHRSTEASGPHGARVLAAGVVGVALSLGLERIQRWVVQRPQPFIEPALVAADDAIRSQSVHSVAGSGLAGLLVLMSFVALGLATSDVQVLRWTMFVPAMLGFPAALVVWLVHGHRAWSVPGPGALAARSPA
jgi:hypothetical protein